MNEYVICSWRPTFANTSDSFCPIIYYVKNVQYNWHDSYNHFGENFLQRFWNPPRLRQLMFTDVGTNARMNELITYENHWLNPASWTIRCSSNVAWVYLEVFVHVFLGRMPLVNERWPLCMDPSHRSLLSIILSMTGVTLIFSFNLKFRSPPYWLLCTHSKTQ